MQGILVLSMAACKAEVLPDVVDIPFHNGPYFIGVIPFFTECVFVLLFYMDAGMNLSISKREGKI